ncbi:Cys-every-fifth RiPP peptide CefA [Lysinibacillus sp. NPDC093216]|uniref:Cys-every-fifth RiPP peptide CefA n=1 Tax=Lysinibacillus sp. NPDC093216 TaxID=3390576 RepID=UPI003CFD7E30
MICIFPQKVLPLISIIFKIKGCPIKGCPIKGCPIKGCPIKGCPIKGCPFSFFAFGNGIISHEKLENGP